MEGKSKPHQLTKVLRTTLENIWIKKWERENKMEGKILKK